MAFYFLKSIVKEIPEEREKEKHLLADNDLNIIQILWYLPQLY